MYGTRPRLASVQYVGRYEYFLTFCTSGRRNAFLDQQNVALVLDQILRTAAAEGFAVDAYCFMPDHVHLLVRGTSDEADLKAFVHAAKQRSGYEFKMRTGDRLWQPSYYDHVVRDSTDAVFYERYIVENPLKARLVDDVEDYPFWGSPTRGRDRLLEAVTALGPTEEGWFLTKKATSARQA